ncbi:MAG: ATP-binding protein [Endomicrobiales bacterium]
MLSTRNVNLSIVFSLCIAVTVLIIMSISTFVTIRRERAAILEQMNERGISLAESLASLSLDSLLVLDYTPSVKLKLNLVAEDIESKKEVIYAIIFNKKNVPVTDIIDDDNPYIVAAKKNIHKDTISSLYNLLKSRNDIMHFEKEMKVGDETFGFARVGISKDILNIESKKALIMETVVNIITICTLVIVILIVFQYLIKVPLSKLMLGIHTVSSGDYSHLIPVHRNDEIGMVSSNFNAMAKDIREKRTIIEDYAHNLEIKVDERTKDLQAANESLKNAQEQLVQSEKMASIGTIAAGVAHEINNPLCSILTNTQILIEEIEDPDQKESLSLIETATRHCKVIVSTLLGYTRKSAALEVKQMLMSEAIDSACDLITTEMSLNIRIEKTYGANEPIIQANVTELTQLFTNLILNGIHAIERAKRADGLITVEVTHDEDFVYGKVTDNGCGIEKANYGKIFDPFYTTQDVGKGTGLGLSVCKQIVAKHYGKLDFTSEVTVGSVFTVVLPKQKDSLTT